ncbi:MAG: hypothetical protein V4707_13730 [Pseudomonadota bacterium]
MRFSAPTLAPGGEFECWCFIEWPDKPRRFYACGVDGVQALMLAMRTAHSELLESDAYQAGRLNLFDQSDLDLPPGWGTGPLYDVPPRG